MATGAGAIAPAPALHAAAAQAALRGAVDLGSLHLRKPHRQR